MYMDDLKQKQKQKRIDTNKNNQNLQLEYPNWIRNGKMRTVSYTKGKLEATGRYDTTQPSRDEYCRQTRKKYLRISEADNIKSIYMNNETEENT